jgi:hypothetical protein
MTAIRFKYLRRAKFKLKYFLENGKAKMGP